MNPTHTQLISDAKNLLAEVQTQNSRLHDPFEEGLSRTSNRIVGAAIGIFTPLSFGGILVADAITDSNKLRTIQKKLDGITTTELDKTHSDYNQTLCARDFQTQVCGNIADYTRTAQKVKLAVVAGCLLTFPLAYSITEQMLTARGLENLVIDPVLNAMANCGTFVFYSSMAYGLYHRFFARPVLDLTNQTLAQQASKKLYAC